MKFGEEFTQLLHGIITYIWGGRAKLGLCAEPKLLKLSERCGIVLYDSSNHIHSNHLAGNATSETFIFRRILE